MTTPFASLWLAAGMSGFAQQPDWANWADREIMRLAAPPDWIIRLSLAKSIDDLWTTLSDQVAVEVEAGADSQETFDAVLGYYWLRFKRGDFGITDFLRLAGEHADNYDTCLACETVFGLLDDPQQTAVDKAERLVKPLAELATAQWRLLTENGQSEQCGSSM